MDTTFPLWDDATWRFQVTVVPPCLPDTWSHQSISKRGIAQKKSEQPVEDTEFTATHTNICMHACQPHARTHARTHGHTKGKSTQGRQCASKRLPVERTGHDVCSPCCSSHSFLLTFRLITIPSGWGRSVQNKTPIKNNHSILSWGMHFFYSF